MSSEATGRPESCTVKTDEARAESARTASTARVTRVTSIAK